MLDQAMIGSIIAQTAALAALAISKCDDFAMWLVNATMKMNIVSQA